MIAVIESEQAFGRDVSRGNLRLGIGDTDSFLVDDAEFYSDNVVVAENARYFDRIWLPGREEPVFGNLFPLPVTGCRNRAGFEGDIPQSVIIVPPDRLPAQAAPADPKLDFVAVRVGVNFQGVLIPSLPVPVVGYVARTPIEIAVGALADADMDDGFVRPVAFAQVVFRFREAGDIDT